jgi:flagellar basal-body rod modification protein FlgD
MVNFSPVTGFTPETGTAAPPPQSNGLEGKDAFLQLLVAQIRNQNPLEPADGVEFLSQLAQFSQLEQTMGIRDEISALRTQLSLKTEPTPEGDTNV